MVKLWPMLALAISWLMGSTINATPLGPWVHSLSPTALKQGRWIQSVLLIQSADDDTPQIWQLNKQRFEANTALQIIQESEGLFSQKINVRVDGSPSDRRQLSGLDDWLPELFATTIVDTIILAEPDAKRWTVYSKDSRARVKREFTVKAPKTMTEAAIKQWLIIKTRYSGVVLASRGALVLAALYRPVQPGQAFYMAPESHQSIRIKIPTKDPSRSLQVVQSQGGFAILRTESIPSSLLLSGTKLVSDFD